MDNGHLPYVWEFRYRNAISYGLGVIHGSPIDFVPRANGLVNVVERLAVEFDHSDPEKAKFRSTSCLSESMGEKEIVKLAGILEMDPKDVAKESWLVAQSRLMAKAWKEAFGTFFMDARIVDGARGRKDIISLETAHEQCLATDRYYNSLRSAFEHALRGSRDILGTIKKDVTALANAYWVGDTNFLFKYTSPIDNLSIEDVARNFPEAVEERSIRMAERSLPWLDRPTLICVGLFHFLIEPSIITVYREMGVEVKKIEYKK